MRKYLFALLVLVAAGTTLLVAAFAVAGRRLAQDQRTRTGSIGYQEVPATSRRPVTARSRRRSNDDDSSFDWTLSYSGLEGNVTQSHIHFGQRSRQRRHLDLAVQQPRQRAGRDAGLPAVARRTVSGTLTPPT